MSFVKSTLDLHRVAALMLAVGLFAAPIAHALDMAPAPAGSASGGGDIEVSPTAVVGTAVTYQGRLMVSGSPADGPYDFEFRLYDAAAGGVQIGSVVTIDNGAVADGRFTVSLDFGQSAFGGGARWLDIRVRPGAGGTYTTLSPRQKLNPAPSALSLPNVYTNEATGFVGIGRDFQMSGYEKFGVQATAPANTYGGMYVNTSDAGGWPFYGFATGGSLRAWTWYNGTTSSWNLYNGGDRLQVTAGGGLEIFSTATNDGLRINATPDDGIQIGSGVDYPSFGVYIPSPGVSSYGLWPNTANATGNYALYTPDNIEAGVITLSAQTVVAKVRGVGSLSPGDLAAANGVTDPVPGATNRLATVQLAGAEATGVIGVVATRMEWRQADGKDEMVLMPADGAARDGDYVSLVVLGVADVRVAPGAAIARGARLTAADAGGAARALRTESLNGMTVTEGAPVIGVALADARGRDVVPVFVNLR